MQCNLLWGWNNLFSVSQYKVCLLSNVSCPVVLDFRDLWICVCAVSLCLLTGRMPLPTWCLQGEWKQVRKRVNFYMCFSVPLSCPLVLCNRIHATQQPEVSVINRVHVTWTRQRFEQVVCAWLSVPLRIWVLSKNHWQVPSNSKNV